MPTVAFLAIGGPVVVHKSPQSVLLGVCNNSDGIIRGIELDPREDFLLDPTPGYSVVNLRYAPLRVFVYIKTADDAGLHLEGLDRGVVAIAPVEKEFTIEGIGKRKFIFKRRQLPLTAGCVSSVFRSQGQTMPKIILDIRPPPGTGMDPAAVYVALSRATSLEALNLLFPVTLEDLNQPPDRDILAIINYLHRLDKETLKLFLQDASRFTPASASLDAATDEGPTPSRSQRRRTTGRHGPGATRRVAHLIANSSNNCFFNSALALGLAAWDGQQLPPSSAGTPAARSFFSALQLLRDFMFDGSALPDHIVVSLYKLYFFPVCLAIASRYPRLAPPPFVCIIIYNACIFPPSILRQSAARQARHDILHGTPIAGAGCDMGNVAGVFEAIARACPQQGSPLWPDSVFDQQARVARTRRDFGLDWRYANNCTIGDHSAENFTRAASVAS